MMYNNEWIICIIVFFFQASDRTIVIITNSNDTSTKEEHTKLSVQITSLLKIILPTGFPKKRRPIAKIFLVYIFHTFSFLIITYFSIS